MKTIAIVTAAWVLLNAAYVVVRLWFTREGASREEASAGLAVQESSVTP